MNEQREPQLDIRIADRFKIVKKIASGSFGKIYEGLDLMTHERVAIKIVSIQLMMVGIGTYVFQIPSSPVRSQDPESTLR